MFVFFFFLLNLEIGILSSLCFFGLVEGEVGGTVIIVEFDWALICYRLWLLFSLYIHYYTHFRGKGRSEKL